MASFSHQSSVWKTGNNDLTLSLPATSELKTLIQVIHKGKHFILAYETKQSLKKYYKVFHATELSNLKSIGCVFTEHFQESCKDKISLFSK